LRLLIDEDSVQKAREEYVSIKKTERARNRWKSASRNVTKPDGASGNVSPAVAITMKSLIQSQMKNIAKDKEREEEEKEKGQEKGASKVPSLARERTAAVRDSSMHSDLSESWKSDASFAKVAEPSPLDVAFSRKLDQIIVKAGRDQQKRIERYKSADEKMMQIETSLQQCQEKLQNGTNEIERLMMELRSLPE
jgi:hypothetical protein